MNFIKNWFKVKPPQTKNKEILSEAYNSKYGDYDYGNDSRVLDKHFLDTFLKVIGTDFKNVIVCGANSGYEVEIIEKVKPEADITAVDISNTSLEKLHSTFHKVKFLHEDLENLTMVESKSFDLYVCLRAIHSTNINIKNAVNEAARITKAKIILSISNGYIVEGELVKGMYDYDKDFIDPIKPYSIKDEIIGYLSELGWTTEIIESDAEIFIIATL